MTDPILIHLRKIVEDEVERLIAFLDHLDGDVDREEDDDDCCPAYDDRPGCCLNDGLSGPGDDDDAEVLDLIDLSYGHRPVMIHADMEVLGVRHG